MFKIINNQQKGFLFKDGNFKKMLNSGKYNMFFGKQIETVSLYEPISSEFCSLDILLKDSELLKCADIIDVEDEHLALHFVNGKFSECLQRGKYAFWNIYDKHDFKLIDTSKTEITEDVPKYIIPKLPISLYSKIEVAQHQKARLYFDKKFVRILDSGTYYFWRGSVRVEAEYVDTRLLQMNITGQEILTQDKVSLRINFVCSYNITDFVKISNINDYEEQIHITAQLALREFVGKYKVDEILENKDRISTYVFDKLKEKEAEFFISIKAAGVKDIILPGEIRDIMNMVLIAEKKAQANVISRREEVASTRSLLNTAKLMDENKTLYKLKELEYIEKICERVGNINVSGSGDILTQLSDALKGN